MVRTGSTVLVVVILQLLASESLVVAQQSICTLRIQKVVSDWQFIDSKNQGFLSQEKPLTYEQVNSTYLPSCNPDGSFQKRQCFYEKACWCSRPDGSLIEGSFQQGIDLDCEACKVGNKTYMNGESFYMEEKCEYCTCNNQNVKCQKYFCNNTGNNTEAAEPLKAELEQELKEIILKAIYIWYEHRHHSNLPEINKESLEAVPLETALLHRTHRLRWTFKRLDKNKDDRLTEEYEFRFLMEDIDHLFTSKPTFLKLFSIFNKDDDQFITENEWLAGFNDLEPSSDEVSGSGVRPSINDESTSRRTRKTRRSALEAIKSFVKKLHGEKQRMHS
ncbi:uncharacterized protein [Dysidea avara]|uniref:uncharacterized protein n=1 Tax=Dysidea avara TaxID=196820 RepID=UPI003318B3C4